MSLFILWLVVLSLKVVNIHPAAAVHSCQSPAYYRHLTFYSWTYSCDKLPLPTPVLTLHVSLLFALPTALVQIVLEQSTFEGQ